MEGNAEGDCRCVPHRADREEVVRVILAARRTQFEELTPCLARGRDNDSISCRIQNPRNRVLAAQGIVIRILALRV